MIANMNELLQFLEDVQNGKIELPPLTHIGVKGKSGNFGHAGRKNKVGGSVGKGGGSSGGSKTTGKSGSDSVASEAIKNSKSDAFGGTVNIPDRVLENAYHITSVEAASKILDQGFKSASSIDKTFGEEAYPDSDGGKWVYMSATKAGAAQVAVGTQVRFTVDLTNSHKDGRVVYQPKFEGGLLMTHTKVSRFAIKNVEILDKSANPKRANDVLSKWRTIDRFIRAHS